MHSFSRLLASLFFALALLSFIAVANATNISSTILVLAHNKTRGLPATSGLNAYGIPYELIEVPPAGIPSLPALSASNSDANYGGIIILGDVSYDYGNGNWRSALTQAQFDQLFAYQTAFGVRMVRLDMIPSEEFGLFDTSRV
jgi:hypothetical protein